MFVSIKNWFSRQYIHAWCLHISAIPMRPARLDRLLRWRHRRSALASTWGGVASCCLCSRVFVDIFFGYCWAHGHEEAIAAMAPCAVDTVSRWSRRIATSMPLAFVLGQPAKRLRPPCGCKIVLHYHSHNRCGISTRWGDRAIGRAGQSKDIV